ncbi:MAG: hypothetical protein IK990_10820 [Ruminiclostridium sp.]|nr:hypothetical protein [Ruminiclostridium sp.]
MKKVLSILIMFIIVASYFNMSSFAYDTVIDDEIIVMDINSAEKSSNLSIDYNNKATCNSIFSDINSNIYKIKVVQTLEKHWAFGVFFAVNNASWERTFYTDSLSMTNYKYNLEGGTYRVKTTFIVTLYNGQTESIDVYSSEVVVYV